MENVRTGCPLSFCISPTTIVESIPPDKKAPKGTSLSKRIRTEEVSNSRSSRASSSTGRSSSAWKSTRQYGFTSSRPSQYTARWPGGNLAMPR